MDGDRDGDPDPGSNPDRERDATDPAPDRGAGQPDADRDDGDAGKADADGESGDAGWSKDNAGGEEGDRWWSGEETGSGGGSAGWSGETAEEDEDAGGSRDRGIVAPLRQGVREHRPHILLSAGLFLVGVVIGLAMVGRVDLFAVMGIEDASQLFPDRVTAATILFNNTRAAVVLVLGALSLGVVTALVLVFNGILVGYVAGGIAAEYGVGFVLLAVVPHGIIELPAVFAAGAVAFRVVHMTVLRILGRRDVVLGRDGWRRAGLLLGATWLALVVAALVEFHVTTRILEAAGVG